MNHKTDVQTKTEQKTGGRQIVGEVVSLKTPNTAIISVTRTFRHPLYKKTLRKTRRMAVHYENMDLQLNDRVRVKEVRPMSKTKHFVVVEKVETV